MAIVKTIKCSNGAIVQINDECCTGLSKEEIARRKAEIDRVVNQIYYKYAVEQLRKQQENRNT